MKRLMILAALLAVVSCTPAKDELRTGDLVFVGLPMDYCPRGFVDTTYVAPEGVLNLIHVGIVDVAPSDSVFIIDVYGARGTNRRSLESFLRDYTLRNGTPTTFLVKRLKVKAPGAIDNALAYCGQPFDSVFAAHNNALYCSELVHDSYRSANGDYLFEEYPMDWKDANGNIPPYWRWLFSVVGSEIPEGIMGTTPLRMSQSPLLKSVDVNLRDYAK